MVLDGKALAQSILTALATDVRKLKENGITPTMAVISIGDNPASASYVRQKDIAAQKIGAGLRHIHFADTITKEDLEKNIRMLSDDPHIHGIIIQRPVPDHLNEQTTVQSIVPQKDLDGFIPLSPYTVPVALAVYEIVKKMFQQTDTLLGTKQFEPWLRTQHIAVIGKGETAGGPIARFFQKQKCLVSIIHSQTSDGERSRILRDADIVISCVGKERIIKADDIKKDAFLISVGIWRDSEGKLHGDYDERDVENTASCFTPTPGGVGPVNVSFLMQNLVRAAGTLHNPG